MPVRLTYTSLPLPAQFCFRRWIFVKDGSIDAKCRLSAELGHTMRTTTVGIENLIARNVILNPGVLDPGQFVVVYQRPGQIIKSRLAHCVYGCSIIHFAWNRVPYDILEEVVKAEYGLANIVRTQFFDSGALASKPDFLFTCEFVDVFVRCQKNGNPFPDKLKHAAQRALQLVKKNYLSTTFSFQHAEVDFRNFEFDIPSQRHCFVCKAPMPIGIYYMKLAPNFACAYCVWKQVIKCTTLFVSGNISFISDPDVANAANA